MQSKIEATGVKVFSIKRTSGIQFSVIRKLKQVLITYQPDILHTHHSAEVFYAFFSSIGLKVKKIHTHHTHPKINTIADKIVFKLLLPFFDSIVFPSKTVRKLYKSISGSDKVIFNGLDLKRVKSSLNKDDARLRLNLPQSTIILGMAGSFLYNIRDQKFLCEALPVVLKKYPNINMVFAGSANSLYSNSKSYFLQCKEIIKKEGLSERVFFPGNIEDISLFYTSLDAYLHASKFDTFSLSVAEAVSNNKYTLINDIDVFKELYTENDNVIFYKDGSKQDFQYQLETLIKANFKLTNESVFSPLFDIRRYIKSINSLYKEILDK